MSQTSYYYILPISWETAGVYAHCISAYPPRNILTISWETAGVYAHCVSAYPRIQLFPGYSFEVSGYSAVTPLTASSRDAGPATANEPTSLELLAMLECSVSTSERCYEEAIITERSYSYTTFFLGICHCMLIARFSNCAWSIQMLMS